MPETKVQTKGPHAPPPLRRFGWMANPAWERAPGLLRRFPGLLAAVVGAGFVLGLVSASQPLFVSSSENAALHANLKGLCPWTLGLQVSALQPLNGQGAAGPLGQPIPSAGLFGQRDDAVRAAVAGVEHLGPKELTIVGNVATAGLATAPVRLLSRDGFRSHVRVVTDAGVPGVWMPDATARLLKVKAGDALQLSMGTHSARTRVAGIYRSLVSLPPSPFWCSQTTEIYGLDPNSAPPGLLLVDRATMFALSFRLQDGNVFFSWEYPVVQQGLTLPQAQTLASRAADAQRSVLDPEGGFPGVPRPQIESDIQSVVPQVMQTVDQIRSPAFSVALAGRLVALLVLAAVGVYWLDRRRTEADLLSAKGVGPFGIASKAALEVALPLAIASAAAWFTALWLVSWLGPGSLLSSSATSSAVWSVAWTCLVGIVLLSVVVAAAVRAAEGEGGVVGASILTRTPWEIVILVLMAASLYEILTRGGGTVTADTGQARVDILLILFPILFVGGASGLAVRGLRRLLPKLRSLGTVGSQSMFLATRRLTAASGIALGLLTAVALSVGILAYAGALSASTAASADAKARVFVGSDLRTTLLAGATPPRSLASRSTVVLQFDGVLVFPGQTSVTVLAVDPATFARGAYWNPSLSDRPLADLMKAIAAQGPQTPAIVAGGSVGSGGTLHFPRITAPIEYRAVATVKAFPVQRQHEIYVIVDRARLAGETSGSLAYLLAKGDPSSVLATLSRAQVGFSTPVTTEGVRDSPTVIVLRWLYGYLLAMGVVTGLIVLAALVLYLAARQRGRVVSYALARRMGLTAARHRRSLFLEIAGMLLIGFVLGTGLAWLGARLVAEKLDPLPTLPPPALFRLPWALYALTAAVLLVAAWLGAWIAQRGAEGANVAEVMRVG